MNETTTKVFAIRTTRLMQAQGLNQSQLAEKSGVGQGTISRLLKGDSKTISDENANKIAVGLGVPIDQLQRGLVPVQRPKVSRTILDSDSKKIIAETAKAVISGIKLDPFGMMERVSNVFKEVARPEISELAWILLHRSMSSAIGELIGQTAFTYPDIHKHEAIARVCAVVQDTLDESNAAIDENFMRDPAPQYVKAIQKRLDKALVAAFGELVASSKQGTVAIDATKRKMSADARQIVKRLPYFFHSSLQREFESNRGRYGVLRDQVQSGLDGALSEDLAWLLYDTRLERIKHEPVFDETFALSEIFVELNGYVELKRPLSQKSLDAEDEFVQDLEESEVGRHGDTRDGKKRRYELVRKIMPVREHLESWLKAQRESYAYENAVRFISGEPGRGKSTLMKMYARDLGNVIDGRAVLVPLIRLTFGDDLARALDEFCEYNDIPKGLLSRDSKDPLLLIFDGLDELSKAGKEGAEAAHAFVRRVLDWIRTYGETRKLSVLFCGRPISVDASTPKHFSEHVLHLLPYFLIDKTPEREWQNASAEPRRIYEDPQNLLDCDLRGDWWRRFSTARGLADQEVPEPWQVKQANSQMSELTSEPLLSYFVALAFLESKGQLRLDSTNALYAEMLQVIKNRPYMQSAELPATREFETEEYEELLEHVALVAYHHSQRHVTKQQVAREVPEHLRKRLEEGVGSLQKGLFRLMVGFFAQTTGDSQASPVFEFTHKSFAEYLASRAMRKTVQGICKSLCDSGAAGYRPQFETKDALDLWARVFGPTAISFDLLEFLRNEFDALEIDASDALRACVADLLATAISEGLPMENVPTAKVGTLTFKEMEAWARNAESSMLIIHGLCAKPTVAEEDDDKRFSIHGFSRPVDENAMSSERASSGETVHVSTPSTEWNSSGFATWLRRVSPQMEFAETSVLLQCLGPLNLRLTNLSHCVLTRAKLNAADLSGAELRLANLSEANLSKANLSTANLSTANLSTANLSTANLSEANLSGANLFGAKLSGANLRWANLSEANLSEANLSGAKLREANLSGAKLFRANLSEANLFGANLSEANLFRANLSGANLSEANLFGAKLSGANLRWANLSEANLSGANLFRALIKRGILSAKQQKSIVGEPRYLE